MEGQSPRITDSAIVRRNILPPLVRRHICHLRLLRLSITTTRMRVFVFVSTKDREVLGFSPDRAGGYLPVAYAPWEPLETGGAILVGDDPDASIVMEGIQRDGFFLAVGGYEDPHPERVVQ